VPQLPDSSGSVLATTHCTWDVNWHPDGMVRRCVYGVCLSARFCLHDDNCHGMDCPFAVRVETAVHCRGGGRPACVGRYDSFGRTRMVLAAGHAGGLGPILPRLAGILETPRCFLSSSASGLLTISTVSGDCPCSCLREPRLQSGLEFQKRPIGAPNKAHLLSQRLVQGRRSRQVNMSQGSLQGLLGP